MVEVDRVEGRECATISYRILLLRAAVETRCVRAQVSEIWSEVGFDVGGGVAGG